MWTSHLCAFEGHELKRKNNKKKKKDFFACPGRTVLKLKGEQNQ